MCRDDEASAEHAWHVNTWRTRSEKDPRDLSPNHPLRERHLLTKPVRIMGWGTGEADENSEVAKE